MPESAAGGGTAYPPTVVVENNVTALEAALAQAREEAEDRIWDDVVARCQAKVAKIQAMLDDAKSSLAVAEAERDAYRAAKADAAPAAGTTPEA